MKKLISVPLWRVMSSINFKKKLKRGAKPFGSM